MIYPWQQSQWQQISAQYAQQRLPHALLFYGQQGLGKKDFASAVASGVLCESETLTACGVCRHCQLFRAGSHPDFYGVFPEENSKTIKVDQIRDLMGRLTQTAQLARYQVVIIEPAEAMNAAAANALLKTLEEPPGAVVIILISHRLGGVPVTILSRCQQFSFFATADQATVNWLAPQINHNAQQLLKMANQSPLLALELAKENYISLRDTLLQHLSAIYFENKNPLQDIDIFLKNDLSRVLQSWLLITMDLLRLQLNMTQDFLVNEDQLSSLQKLSQKIPQKNLLTMLEKLQLAWKSIHGSIAVNLNLLLEGIFLEWTC